MSLSRRQPSRKQSAVMASSLSLLFLTFISLICLCPLNAAAAEKSEYGTVIGIGEYFSNATSIPRGVPDTNGGIDLGTTYVKKKWS
jgi:hypothetical protein